MQVKRRQILDFIKMLCSFIEHNICPICIIGASEICTISFFLNININFPCVFIKFTNLFFLFLREKTQMIVSMLEFTISFWLLSFYFVFFDGIVSISKK